MKITLNEAVDAYCSRASVRSVTNNIYRAKLKLMLAHVGGEKLIAEIHPFDMKRYEAYLHQRETIQSDVTYNGYIKQAKLFFDWCVKAKLIEESPADILEYLKVEDGGEGWQPMEETLYQRLLDYVSQQGRGYKPRDEALVRFLADTGVRCKSASEMLWTDVNLNEGIATIRHQKVSGKKGQVVAWSPECNIALTRWHLKQKRTAKNETVFSYSGKRIGSKSLNKYFRRLCEAAGIGGHGTHSLRNRYGIRAVRRFGIVHTAKIMNISEIIVAKHYVKESEEQLLDMMRNLASDDKYTFAKHHKSS